MSYETAAQTIVYQALTLDAGVMALVQGVFDHVPQGQAFPYITIGEDIHSEWDTNSTLGSDCSITIHTWSRARGRAEIKAIQAEIYEALHRAEMTYPGYRIVSINWEGSQSFMDADALTRHGVQTFRVLIEQS